MLRTRYSSFATLLVALSLFGCTTMRSVESSELAAVIAALEPDDRVSVLTASGWQENLVVVTVTDTTLELATREGEPVTVNRNELLELQVRVPGPGKRAGLIAGIVSGAFIALALAAGWEWEF